MSTSLPDSLSSEGGSAQAGSPSLQEDLRPLTVWERIRTAKLTDGSSFRVGQVVVILEVRKRSVRYKILALDRNHQWYTEGFLENYRKVGGERAGELLLTLRGDGNEGENP